MTLTPLKLPPTPAEADKVRLNTLHYPTTQGSAVGLHLVVAGDASIYFFPINPMPVYQLKYRYWYVGAENAHQAKRKAINTIVRNAEKLIDVQTPKKTEMLPLWKLFLFGK